LATKAKDEIFAFVAVGGVGETMGGRFFVRTGRPGILQRRQRRRRSLIFATVKCCDGEFSLFSPSIEGNGDESDESETARGGVGGGETLGGRCFVRTGRPSILLPMPIVQDRQSRQYAPESIYMNTVCHRLAVKGETFVRTFVSILRERRLVFG
jgi:hypothetical protein